jgi:hypothetical protein
VHVVRAVTRPGLQAGCHLGTHGDGTVSGDHDVHVRDRVGRVVERLS